MVPKRKRKKAQKTFQKAAAFAAAFLILQSGHTLIMFIPPLPGTPRVASIDYYLYRWISTPRCNKIGLWHLYGG
jgi:hypothetical protein